MVPLLRKYASKLAAQGVCEPGTPLLGGLDAEIVWNRDGDEIPFLEKVIAGLNINSILFSRPAEPFFSIINAVARHSLDRDGSIYPQDTETRTFLHDIPVVPELQPGPVIQALRRRKAVIVPERGIVTFGIVSPEQAFIIFSSVCFSTYVKVLTDFAGAATLSSKAMSEYGDIVSSALSSYGEFIGSFAGMPAITGPFISIEPALEAIVEAGRLTVASHLVESFFGNISCLLEQNILISQTGSSLDELEGMIDSCPLDNSSTAGITASSELSAHRGVYASTDRRTILHGHPKYSVIMSMLCDDAGCGNRGQCHVKCGKKRSVCGIPIVPGEVGTGPTGLCNTLPPALSGKGAIVWGHGLFTTGAMDFTDAFRNLIEIESNCFREYANRARGR